MNCMIIMNFDALTLFLSFHVNIALLNLNLTLNFQMLILCMWREKQRKMNVMLEVVVH